MAECAPDVCVDSCNAIWLSILLPYPVSVSGTTLLHHAVTIVLLLICF